MKPKSPSKPDPKPEYKPIDDSHGAWANVWHPAWESATDPSSSGSEAQENLPDDSSAEKSPRTSSTAPEEQSE